MTDDQIKHMVGKFLAYRFPDDIQPDGGLSICRVFNEGTPHEFKATPSGTNLLNAAQATEMVRHMTAGFPHTAGAIAAMGERDGWMPIESAPKDGTRVLLWMEPMNDARFQPTDGPHQVIATWVVWSDAMKREGMKDGWSWYGSPLHYPTRWRPLPPAPATEAKGSGQ